jgi:hypothetical protein
MVRRHPLIFVFVVCAAACGSQNRPAGQPDLSTDSGSLQGVDLAGGADLAHPGQNPDLTTQNPDLDVIIDPPGKCVAKDLACTMDKDCCSELCSSSTHTCADPPPPVTCAPAGGLCLKSTDCCAGTCTTGRCSFPPGSSCHVDGWACLVAAECCSAFCDQTQYVCAPHPTGGSCLPRGSLCNAASTCCNGSCSNGLYMCN